MRAIIQRVNTASVVVNNQVISEIGKGVLVLVGITDGDTKDDAEYIQRKVLCSPSHSAARTVLIAHIT